MEFKPLRGIEDVTQQSSTSRYMSVNIANCLLSLLQISVQRKWLKCTETMLQLCYSLTGMTEAKLFQILLQLCYGLAGMTEAKLFQILVL